MVFYIGISIQTNEKIKDNGNIYGYVLKFNKGFMKEAQLYIK